MENIALERLSLGAMMGDEFNVHITPNKDFGFDLWMESDDLELHEKEIHEYAAESFAILCKRYLSSYDAAIKMKKRLEK